MTDVRARVNELYGQVMRQGEGPAGHYRVEDVLSAGAAFAGECCVRRARDYAFGVHTFAPGSPVFSDAVNQLLFGEQTNWEKMPDGSGFGGLYRMLTAEAAAVFDRADFPDVEALLKRHAASVGQPAPAGFGYVALAVGSDHIPRQPPLRVAYDLRNWAAIMAPDLLEDVETGWTVSRLVLGKLLAQTRTAIAPDVALMIAFETLNAMAKSAPLLPRHLEEAARGPEPPPAPVPPSRPQPRPFGRRNA